MIQIPDAPWIREAECNGYPVGEDYEEDDDDWPFKVPCCTDTCAALCYEHEAGMYSALCTDSEQTLRGEARRVLLTSRHDIRDVRILRPAWCNKEEGQ